MDLKRILILAALIIYIVSPVDFMPGIFLDDLVAVILAIHQVRLPSEKANALGSGTNDA